MQLEWTEEQRMIRDSALDWLAGNYDFRQREPSLFRDGGSPAAWSAMAEMGWMGLTVPDALGGVGMGLPEYCLLLQTLGRHLVVEPVGPAVQAAHLLARAGSAQQQQAWLPGVIQGRLRLALVHAEAGAAMPWSPPATMARRTDRGWLLDGRKHAVPAAPGADRWIVSARAADDGRTCLFLVDPQIAGISLDAYETTDGGRAGDIGLQQVLLEPDALLPQGNAAPSCCLQAALIEGVIGDAWYAVGAMQAALQQTAAYVQQRRQFGQALSQLQVVQHRIAEMAVQCAEAEGACELAVLRTASDPAAAPAAASMVRNKVARSARYVGQQSIQLHGAMGVCEELPIAATFRALTAWAQRDGDADSHAASYGAQLLATGSFEHSQVLA